MMGDAEKRIRARKREDVKLTVMVDTAADTWEVRAKDGLVTKGTVASRNDAKVTIEVPLGYDASAYFDALVDRKRARDRAEQQRAALEAPFELAVREEQAEDEV
jgi:hypothetical protein